jgi:hypothetical protein
MAPKELENWNFIGILVSPQITRLNPMQFIRGCNWKIRDKFLI